MDLKKLAVCRICLVEDVRMYVVVNKNLQELYEKLTDVPFVSEDRRPMLACFFCCAKLKQCEQFQRKCLEAEALFAQMLNEDCESKPSMNHDHIKLSGFITTPVSHMSIDSECLIEITAIKEELPDVCERQDDVDKAVIELHSVEPEENLRKNYPDVNDVWWTRPSEADGGTPDDNVTLLEIKCEVELEEETPQKKQRSMDSESVSMWKTKLDSQGTKLEVIRKQKKDLSDRYICDICQRGFRYMNSLIRHIQTHSNERPFKCEICQRSFKSSSNLKNHVLTHSGEKPYECETCHRCFTQKSHLKYHYIHVHSDDRPYKCDKCHLGFSDADSLRSHVVVHDEKRYKCEICLRSFSIEYHLTKHCCGDKPYKCQLCQRSFSKTNHLSRHMLTHSGEKPYQCHICQSSFRRSEALMRHTQMHTNEKPFKCEICPRSFFRKDCLTEHIRKHNNENPFKCDVCQRSFNKASNLKRHIIRIHAGEKT